MIRTSESDPQSIGDTAAIALITQLRQDERQSATRPDRSIMAAFKRIIAGIVAVLILAVFALFVWNFYRRAIDEPERPPVIYERSDRPSRA